MVRPYRAYHDFTGATERVAWGEGSKEHLPPARLILSFHCCVLPPGNVRARHDLSRRPLVSIPREKEENQKGKQRRKPVGLLSRPPDYSSLLDYSSSLSDYSLLLLDYNDSINSSMLNWGNFDADHSYNEHPQKDQKPRETNKETCWTAVALT